MASVNVESHAPMPPTTSGSCAIRRCAAFLAFSAESPASIRTSSIFAPPIALIPPLALISFAAVSAPHLMSVPWRAQGPESGAMTAILTGFPCARSKRHGIAVAVARLAAPSAPCLMIVRLVVMISSTSLLCRSTSAPIVAPYFRCSHSKISPSHALVRYQCLVRAFHRDTAGLKHIAAVAGFQCLGDALLDQQDRHAVLRVDLVDALEDRIDDGRR